MKVWVINLDRSPERFAHMQQQLARFDVPFERISAVDGATLAASQIAWWTSAPLAGVTVLTPGEIGCLHSHRKCWQETVDAGEPGAVFEDDVLVSEDARNYLTADDWIPTDADVVELETFLRPILVDKHAAAARDRELLRLRGEHLGSAGYIVTPRSAERLLKLDRALPLPVDHLLFDPESPAFATMTIYQMSPAICVQQQVVASRRARRLAVPSDRAARFFASDLKDQRALRRPSRSPVQRIARAIRRPFAQVADAATRAFTTATTERRWTTVGFR